MKKSLLALYGVMLALSACSSSPPARGEGAAIKVSALVEAVDVPARTITLKGPHGNVETFKVGEEVKRLAEIKAGDTITADYKVAATAELREPTAEEKNEPLILAQGADRAPADKPPGAAFARAVRMVALVESVNPTTQTFALHSPLEGTIAVHVEDSAAFAKIKPGQAVVATFVESLLLSVEPGPKKP
jgi:hypothetical protein